MEENLVGYLLNSLDADGHRQVEAYLRENTSAPQQLEQLRRVLEPLAADAEAPLAPPGLWIRTLAHIAEDRCRPLPLAPQPVTVLAEGGGSRSWWRRSDLLIAASLLLLAGLISIPWVGHLRERHGIEVCKNNLRTFHTALATYADEHEGDFPKVLKDNMAGIVVPVLNEAKLLRSDLNLTCPGNGKNIPGLPRSAQELNALHANGQSGCFAYSLGYEVPGANGQAVHCHLRRDSGDLMPIMGDRPPFKLGEPASDPGNSPNHGGRGQNILHIGGNVVHRVDRKIGGDDIYLNAGNRVGVGTGPNDTVLGSTWASPYPK